MKKMLILLLLAPLLISCKEMKGKQCAQKDKTKGYNINGEGVNTSGNHFVLPEVPKAMIFAGENILLEDLDLRERLDYELIVNNFWHSNTILIMKRANRWFPIMKSMLKEQNLPEDLVYITVIESGLMNVTSPAGAKGFWQLMEVTAKEYGLIINEEVDERYDIEKSTKVAGEYLKKAYQEFGSWPLAVAAYNRGVRGIKRAQNQQGVDSFFDLLLNNETARYVYRLLAVKLIFENPEKYGFYLEKEDLYPPYLTKEVLVKTSIENINEWAIEQGTSIKIVRKLNPWLVGKELKVKEGEEWKVKLPKNKGQLGLIGG